MGLTKTFSQDPKVRRIQELLPELRMAPVIQKFLILIMNLMGLNFSSIWNFM